MATHNQFEIDGAWSEIIVTSRYGDKAHYKINSLTKEVHLKTRLGDGNYSEWRNTNCSYDALIAQPHEKVLPGGEVETVEQPQESHDNGQLPSTVDLESVAPFGRKKQKAAD